MTQRRPTLLLLSLLLAACDVAAPPTPRSGAELNSTYCALCHGERGEGYVADHASAINHPAFLATVSDDFLRAAVARGRPGTAMSAFGRDRGGPLTDAEVDTLVAHLRSAQSSPSLDVAGEVVVGEPLRGAPNFEFRCASCHGDRGQGGTALSLANPEFLATASDGFLRHAVAAGRVGTPMPGYSKQLTPQAVNDLVALIRSWQVPVNDAPVEAPVFDPAHLVLNPDGPEPTFGPPGATGSERFVKVDTVKAELDRGAAMVILDARAGSDYVLDHIAGATSVPFFDVAKYTDRLPRERWIVTYCACPHAASEAAADALARAGFTRLRVLDEGYNVWRDRGYPIRLGSTP